MAFFTGGFNVASCCSASLLCVTSHLCHQAHSTTSRWVVLPTLLPLPLSLHPPFHFSLSLHHGKMKCLKHGEGSVILSWVHLRSLQQLERRKDKWRVFWKALCVKKCFYCLLLLVLPWHVSPVRGQWWTQTKKVFTGGVVNHRSYPTKH